MGSGRGYSFDSNVPSHLKAGKMRYEQKSFTVKGAGNASIWRKCNHCDRDLLGEDSLAEHLVLQHNEPIGPKPPPLVRVIAPDGVDPQDGIETVRHPLMPSGKEWVGPEPFGPGTQPNDPDDEGHAKRNQDFSLEG
jgi:hypothetical protein